MSGGYTQSVLFSSKEIWNYEICEKWMELENITNEKILG